MVFCRIILTLRGENVNTNRITFYLFKLLFLFREYSGYFLGRLGLWYIPPRGDIPPQRQNTTEHARKDKPPPVLLPSTSTEKSIKKSPVHVAGAFISQLFFFIISQLFFFIISHNSMKGKSNIHNTIIAPPFMKM